MSELLVRTQPRNSEGKVIDITPQTAGWRYVGFKVFKLQPGETLARATDDREVCLVLVSGRATVTAQGQVYENIGARMSVFEKNRPFAVYCPNDSHYEVTALTALEIAECSAPGRGNYPARLITPDDVVRSERGTGTNRRIIHDILMGNGNADSLLITEVYTPAGHWSSYPSHKHDTDALPQESYLEETYYHKLDPAQGFAFQRVYTDDRSLDETMTVENDTVVLVPRGYHPVGTPHGYDLYYLNTMAGPKREWVFHNDPDHEWILAADRDRKG